MGRFIKKRSSLLGRLIISFCCWKFSFLQAHQIIVLGDSLSDSGNFPELTLFPNIPLILDTQTPKTDGTVWAVWLDQMLNSEWLLPSSQSGTNYSFSGAFTDGANPLVTPPSYIPSLMTQTTQIPPKISRRTPVFVWGGANDFIITGFDRTIPTDQPIISATNLGNIVQVLHKKGFKNLIVLSMPDLGDIPALKTDSDFVKHNPDISVVQALGFEFNALLTQVLNSKKFPVLGIDIVTLFHDVINYPSQYDFTNVTTATPTTQGEPIIVGDIHVEIKGPHTDTDGHLFWFDGEHPTHKVHRTIADYIYTTIIAPNFFGDLSQKTFSVSREIMSNIRQQSVAVQPCHLENTLYPFINGSYEPLLQSPSIPHVKNEESNGGNVTYGATWDFNSHWRLGAAGSYAQHAFEDKQPLTKYHADVTTQAATLFGGYQWCYSYVSAALTTSWHDFTSLKRKYSVGFSTHRAKGKTHGFDFHGQLTGAYLELHPTKHLFTGPIADLNYQHVSIDGYSEKHARVGNLQFKGYKNDIFTSGLGWELRYMTESTCPCRPKGIVIDSYIMANRQWLSHTQQIRFRQISFGKNFGAWPVSITKPNNYLSAGISLSANLLDRAIFNFGYDLNVGSRSMSEQVLTMGFSVPLNFKKKVTEKSEEKPSDSEWSFFSWFNS